MIRLIAITLSVVVAWLSTMTTYGQTTAEKLGYPAGSRVLILHATDAGTCWESNQGVKEVLAGGMVKSASVVATGPWSDDFIEWARRQPELDFGVSLALHNPYPRCKWRFAAPANLIPSLVDYRGFPCSSATQMAMNAQAQEVEHEFLEQLRTARDAGLRITHLSSLDGTAFSRTDLAAVIATVSRQQWIPAPVVELTPEILTRFREQGLELDPELQNLVGNYPLPKLDNIEFVPRGDSFAATRDAFLQLMDKMEPGLALITFRPLVESEGVKLLDPNWQHRVWERQLLLDPQVRQRLKNGRIVFTSWLDVMSRFESQSASDPAPVNTSTP
jgi:hypothetical protein